MLEPDRLTRGRISPALLWAVAAAAGRELSWGLPAVSRECATWRVRAQAIPSPAIRADALYALDHKRGHTDGAALFTILPRGRNAALLRLLVAFELMVDYLDNVHERHPTWENGQRLHRALIDALEPRAPMTVDYYAFHPWRDDGGYLSELVETCRQQCLLLPSFSKVERQLRCQTRRALVLGLNHEPDPVRRDAELRAWASREFPRDAGLDWFELSGAASATLAILGLLTAAATPNLDSSQVAPIHAAMWPWGSLATTMLDSYVDQPEDRAADQHSYVSHYPDLTTAVGRISEAICRAFDAAQRAPRRERHVLIVACMIAMYLTKDGLTDPRLRDGATALADAGGPLVKVLMPALRLWRRAYAQRS